jgi:S1-C subfamily serine protease
MFNGAGIIESLLPGGPAHASRKIDKGDKILEVDGSQVLGNSLLRAITGSDMPGSVVCFRIQKPSVLSSLHTLPLHRFP